MKNLLSLIICIVAIGITACKKTQNNTAIISHLVTEPENLHPCNGSSSTRAEINLYIHETLLKLNFETGELMPCLVKSLPVITNNGLNYSYELKDDVTWDDKTSITAKDICFTIKANKCLLTDNPSSKSAWENVQDIIIDSEKKFTIVMKQPYILNTWMWLDYPVIQESFYDHKKTLVKYSTQQLSDSLFLKNKQDIIEWAKEFNSPKYYSDPNFISGCGPYKLAKWNKGENLILERKQNHWTNQHEDLWYCQSYPTKIIYKLNNNNASTLLEFKNALIDASTLVDYTTFTELSSDKVFTEKYITKLANSYNYTYIALNTKPDGEKHKKIFNDPAVRKAMAMLIPYDQINKTLYQNYNKRITGPSSPFKSDYNSDLKPIEYDVEKAKSVLQQSGWNDTDNDGILDKVIDGRKVKLEYDLNFMSTQKQWENMAKQISESMSKAKVSAKLKMMDYNSFITAAMNHDFDMSIGAWQSSAQPEDYSQLWHTTSWLNNGFNFTGFGTPQTDALIDSINHSVDNETRIKLSKRFQKLIYDEQPYIYLFTQARRVIVSKKWDNLVIYSEYPGILLNTLKPKD